MRTCTLLIVAALALAACDKAGNDANVAEAPLETSASTTVAETSPGDQVTPEEPEPKLVADQHPWAEEYHELVATVLSEHTVEYRSNPSVDSEPVARQTLKPDAKISFEKTQTQVFEPFVAKATRVVKVAGTTEDGDKVEQELKPGDSYETYLYAGEGMCFARIAGRIAVGDCPDKGHFQAENWKGQAPVPAKFDLWLKTKKGWFLVDRDAVGLESISTL